MTKLQVIALDFDDVVAAFNQAYVAHHNQFYISPPIQFQNINTYDFTLLYGVDEKTMVGRVRKFCHHHHHEIWPYAGADTVLTQLSKQYEIHIVTSRCESLSDVTQSWLKDNELFDFISGFHFANGYGTLYPDRKRTKLDIYLQLKAIALIEDAPKNADQVASGGIPVLMPKRPWNTDFIHANVKKYETLDQVLEHFV
jgi:5'(3')-deoxyribonucleotidase